MDLKKERKTYQTVALVVYVGLVLLELVMFGARFLSLVCKLHFRNTIDAYPSECSRWA
jgi:hypothetical protein